MTKKTKSPSIADGSLNPSEPKDGGEKDWEANNAADTIQKAHAHMADPELLKRVHKVVGRKMKALQGIHAMADDGGFDASTGLKGLKDYANKFRSKKEA